MGCLLCSVLKMFSCRCVGIADCEQKRLKGDAYCVDHRSDGNGRNTEVQSWSIERKIAVSWHSLLNSSSSFFAKRLHLMTDATAPIWSLPYTGDWSAPGASYGGWSGSSGGGWANLSRGVTCWTHAALNIANKQTHRRRWRVYFTVWAWAEALLWDPAVSVLVVRSTCPCFSILMYLLFVVDFIRIVDYADDADVWLLHLSFHCSKSVNDLFL